MFSRGAGESENEVGLTKESSLPRKVVFSRVFPQIFNKYLGTKWLVFIENFSKAISILVPKELK